MAKLFIEEKKIIYKTAAQEAVLLPVKFSSDDDPGFRQGFEAEASLPLTHQLRSPWPFLTTFSYPSSLKAGPQGYTLYPHRATVCRF